MHCRFPCSPFVVQATHTLRRRNRMQYMLLIHSGEAPDQWDTLSEDEQKAIMGEYLAISQSPGVTDGNQLQPAETATTVRVDDGRTLTTDGPFAETKEALGGYYLLHATTSTRPSTSPPGSPRPGWAAPSRSARWWSAERARRRLPGRVGQRPRCAHRLPRRLRPRRGSRAGGVRGCG